jgi:hypothetical protein
MEASWVRITTASKEVYHDLLIPDSDGRQRLRGMVWHDAIMDRWRWHNTLTNTAGHCRTRAAAKQTLLASVGGAA